MVEELASGFGTSSFHQLLESLIAPERMLLKSQERDILLYCKQLSLIKEKTLTFLLPTTNPIKNPITF